MRMRVQAALSDHFSGAVPVNLSHRLNRGPANEMRLVPGELLHQRLGFEIVRRTKDVAERD